MLYELEWQTPHETPNGYTVPQWVAAVRWFEENGWLRDPAHDEWPADPNHPANRSRALDNRLCPPLCWRKRCRRRGEWRCPHRMPLAVREFMPELSVHLTNLCGDPQVHLGPVNPDKMVILADVFGRAAKPPANRLSRLPLAEALEVEHKDSFIFDCSGRKPLL